MFLRPLHWASSLILRRIKSKEDRRYGMRPYRTCHSTMADATGLADTIGCIIQTCFMTWLWKSWVCSLRLVQIHHARVCDKRDSEMLLMASGLGMMEWQMCLEEEKTFHIPPWKSITNSSRSCLDAMPGHDSDGTWENTRIRTGTVLKKANSCSTVAYSSIFSSGQAPACYC